MTYSKRLFLAGSLLAAGCMMAARPSDILADLGISQDDLRQTVLDNMKYDDSWSFGASSEMKQLARKIPAGSRAAAVQALGKVVRTYAESGQFKKSYQEWLEEEYLKEEPQEEKPQEEEKPKEGPVFSDPREQLIHELYGEMPGALLSLMIQEQVKEAEASKNGRTAATQTTRPLDGKELKRIAALSKSNPEAFKKQYLHYLAMNVDPTVRMTVSSGSGQSREEKEMMAGMRREREAEYKKRSDLKAVMRNRLNQFIDLSGSVDFDAKLVQRGSKQVFANPAYESKDSEWKFLFRLGKEPVMAARAFAQQWSREIK